MENVRVGIFKSIIDYFKIFSLSAPEAYNAREDETTLTGEDLKEFRKVVAASRSGEIKDINDLNRIYGEGEKPKSKKIGSKITPKLNPIAKHPKQPIEGKERGE